MGSFSFTSFLICLLEPKNLSIPIFQETQMRLKVQSFLNSPNELFCSVGIASGVRMRNLLCLRRCTWHHNLFGSWFSSPLPSNTTFSAIAFFCKFYFHNIAPEKQPGKLLTWKVVDSNDYRKVQFLSLDRIQTRVFKL